MSSTPVPPPFDQLLGRPFSLYPPIVGIEHNEWTYRSGTWAEVLLANTKTGGEIWVPRRFIGGLSTVDEPVMIVGLHKELEYTAGQILPHVRRVIQMPRAVNDTFRRPEAERVEASGAAAVVGIRLESGAEGRVGRFVMITLAVGIILCILGVTLFRAGHNRAIAFKPVLQSDLALGADDDYRDVVRKLGAPGAESWQSPTGARQYRILRYPDRGISVILMGAERQTVRYIGAVNAQWQPVHAVQLPGGRDTYAILRSIKPF